MPQARKARFQEVLHLDPGYADALLELANLRIANRKFAEAAEVARRYVEGEPQPCDRILQAGDGGKKLHETASLRSRPEAVSTRPNLFRMVKFPNEHLSTTLNNRSKLDPGPQSNGDRRYHGSTQESSRSTGRPVSIGCGVLEIGESEEAKNTIAQLDKVSSGDLPGLDRNRPYCSPAYHLYDDAIRHFQGLRCR